MDTTKPQMMGPAEWLLLLALSVLWGGSFFFYKVLAPVLPPATLVLGRVAIAAVAMNALLALRGRSLASRRDLWPGLVGMAVLNNVIPFILVAWGETRIASGLAAILNAATPVFAVLVARALGLERLGWNRILGVAFGFAGVAILVGPGAWLAGADPLGMAACLLAALSYSFVGPYGRRFAGVDALTLATGQVSASTLLLLPVAAFADRPWALAMPGAASWAALLGLALLSTALAYVIFFRIMARAGGTNLMLVTFLIPITALLLGHFALAEPFDPWAAAGAGMIAAGLAAIDGRVLVTFARHAGGRHGRNAA